jgi:hypothetical protein
MATSRPRKRSALLLVLPILLLIIFGKPLLSALVPPDLPGYAKTPPTGDYAALSWPLIQQGKWQYGKPSTVDASLRQLEGREVNLSGYLLPLHTPGVSSQFFIAERPRGCYFCNPPGVAEVVQINIAGGRQLQPTDRAVQVYGIFKVASGAPTDSVLYTINDAALMMAR